MLSKTNRLPIQNLPKSGFKSFRSHNLTLKIFTNGLPSSRLGVIISKKTAKLAVKRNELKRAVFNSARIFLSTLPLADYLVIINKDLSKAELQKEIEELFKNV